MISQWGVSGEKNPFAADEGGADEGVDREQPAKTRPFEDALRHGLHEQRADRGDERERARGERG